MEKKMISLEKVKPFSMNEMKAVVGAGMLADCFCCRRESGVVLCDGPRCNQYDWQCPMGMFCPA